MAFLVTEEMAQPKQTPQGATKRQGPHLLAPGHAISEVIDEVLTVPLNQAVLNNLVDHLLCTLNDSVHRQGQVRPIQFVVNRPRAAMQHIL